MGELIIKESTLGITSAKDYISELGKGSFTLQILNEQFRRIAPSLDIVSFYETVLTPIGFKNAKFMILEKESSVLEYPGEISKPLTNVDHHGVCKYQSPNDPNSVTLRNLLKSLFSKILASQADAALKHRKLQIGRGAHIRQTYGRSWALRSCQTQTMPSSEINGSRELASGYYKIKPAGKSVLASAVIHNLVADVTDRYCPYFFIHFADRKKRTLSLVLRSLAYQMGLNVPVFHEEVLDFADDAIGFDRADSRNIWDCIKFALSSIDTIRNSFHLLDYRWYRRGREAAHVTENLADLHLFHLPIRVLLVGRRTNELDAEFRRLPAAVQTTHIEMDGRVEDLAAYANRELTLFRDLDLRKSLTERVMEGAQNNFLANAEAVLEELPGGMKALYDRMAASISTKSPPEREFATKLLQFAACSVRSLKVIELSRALST
ncbi:hypothetical protein MCOR27_001324 [Pyricularia oryzae]|uniref:Nephrocystin 3-like N-terminal domain-containing protein n=1 Tax=Pyricularia grisea TaxID=148305 RepID=A0ABQ8NWR2_PYRGI|nr:hypothetical protein MCOR19_010158 [Pyricularia oryzae]KAI6301902.1 hypothetical protein MCOR33_002739 [Pyricularia grisea]KAI6280833.1 hypothetical protein MCOR26_003593 [Pyricularia oryzae]KAI6287761.1 hypothetical protein MCOR27_001324 [Pyricularia oryzae]KAI6417280.1 hypothetical protein MCOR20_000460 [Pyricularia oryzae]